MRIVESKYFNHKTQKKRRKPFFELLLLIIILAIGWVLYQQLVGHEKILPENITAQQQLVSEKNQNIDVQQPSVDKPKKLRIFTDNEFKVFYDQLLQPNLERVANPPSISGDVLADARIRDIAEQRGYRLRSSPSVELISVNGHSLHEAVLEPWRELKLAAFDKGLGLSIVSGYRSVDTQRGLFLSRLAASGTSVAQVSAGKSNDKVDEVLVTSSIPGYSKHHTGYTFDLLCAGYVFENFKSSPCNTWLVADNYKVAKEHGFIPSYPPLADSQGPDPEAWEYIYVGTDLLYE